MGWAAGMLPMTCSRRRVDAAGALTDVTPSPYVTPSRSSPRALNVGVVTGDLVDDSPVERMNTMKRTDTTSNPPGRSGTNRSVAAGLTLGVIGGTAAGLVFGVPGLTSAASSDVAVTPAALVQQVDNDAVAETPETRPEPGTRMRDAIQSLVDDGTISAEQADAVVAELIESAPDKSERRENRGERREARQSRRQAPEAVQELLELSPEELREQLRAGSTLADIAVVQGVDPQDVIDAIVTEMTERVDAAVADGKLDADAAAEKLAEAQERISDRVNNGRPDRTPED